MSSMHQLIVSVLLEDEELPELYVRSLAMGIGNEMMHAGKKVRFVSGAQSPVPIDPRDAGLNHAWSMLEDGDRHNFKMQYPGVYLALMLLMGDTDVPANPSPRT